MIDEKQIYKVKEKDIDSALFIKYVSSNKKKNIS
jgi:hypothetical protein